MPESAAARLISLNQQAIAIQRLGIPLELGLGDDSVDRLLEINERLMLGQSASDSPLAFISSQDFPPRYASIARMLLEADDPAPVFESIATVDLQREAAAAPLRQALAEPVVIAILIYLGMMFLCLFTVPSLEAQFQLDQREPTGVSAVLIFLKDTLVVWGIGFPILLVGFVWSWRRLAKPVLLRLVPDNRRYTRWLDAESQARALAALAQSGVDETESLELSRSTTSSQEPIESGTADFPLQTPPQYSVDTLNRLANFYHFLAEDRRTSQLARVSVFIGLFLAGTMVFAFALAIFLPWLDVLNHLGSAVEVQS